MYINLRYWVELTLHSLYSYVFVYSVVKLSRCKIQNILCIPSHFGFVIQKVKIHFNIFQTQHITNRCQSVEHIFPQIKFSRCHECNISNRFLSTKHGKSEQEKLCEIKTRAFTYISFLAFFSAPNGYSFDTVFSENKSSYDGEIKCLGRSDA